MGKICTAISGGRMDLSARQLKEIFAHAEEGYPEEVCGIVIGKRGDPRTSTVCRCINLANQYHREDPIRYPRDARTAYIMDPKDLLRIQHEADSKRLEFTIIYHSHTDHEAYFSATDRELALFEGEPLWPHAGYMVVSVSNMSVKNFKVFKWDSLIKDFNEESCSNSTV